jgi:hypothetical protein
VKRKQVPRRRPVGIHLIEKENRLRALNFAAGEWASPSWAVSDEVAKALKDETANIYLHSSRNAPSRFGGRIFDYRKESADSAWPGRIVFLFHYDEDHRGVTTDRTGWRQEVKIIWRTDD